MKCIKKNKNARKILIAAGVFLLSVLSAAAIIFMPPGFPSSLTDDEEPDLSLSAPKRSDKNVKNILLDTDIGPDCDDAGALAVLNICANSGKCRVLGIGHCTSSPYGAGAADAVCRYYGNPDIPMGTYKGKPFLDTLWYRRYNRYLTKNFPNRYRRTQPGDVVEMYRKILASQPDKSVCLITIGPLNNISDLLDSPADSVSPLTGSELTEKKLNGAVFMAGAFPCSTPELREKAEKIHHRKIGGIREFNVASDIPAARNVADKLKTDRYFLGFEAGLVETFAPLHKKLGDGNPVKTAYRLYSPGGGRYSWDPFTVLFAVSGPGSIFGVSERGEVRFDEKGRTLWTPDKNGSDRFIEIKSPPEKAGEEINRLIEEGEPGGTAR